MKHHHETWMLLFIVLRFRTSNTKSFCLEEYSPVYNSSYLANWKTSYDGQNDIISHPPCLDETNKLLTRSCTSEGWSPIVPQKCYNNCIDISEYSPRNFSLNNCVKCKNSYFVSDDEKNICHSSGTCVLSNQFGGFQTEDCENLRSFAVELFNNNERECYAKISRALGHCFHFEQYQKKEPNPNLVLNFKEEKHPRLHLLVYLSGKNFDFREFNIFCVTNAHEKLIVKNVQIVDIFRDNYNDDSEEDENTPSFSLQVYELRLEKFMGIYWCNAFTFPSTSPVATEKILAYRTKPGNEYSLRVVLRNIHKFGGREEFDDLIKWFFYKKLNLENAVIRLMEIFSYDIFADTYDILFHVTTTKSVDPELQFKSLSTIFQDSEFMTVKYFRSSEFCFKQTMKIGSSELNWPQTEIGILTVPKEICFDDINRTPVIRKCEGDFLYGAIWSNIRGSCHYNYSLANNTIILKESLDKEVSLFPIERVYDVIKDVELEVLDLYYIVRSLERFRKSNFTSTSLTSLFDVLEKIIEMNNSVLKNSQMLLNLTDSVLNDIDDIVSETSFSFNSTFVVHLPNILIYITNPFLTNVTGLKLYQKNPKVSSLMDFYLEDFERSNCSFENVAQNDLQLAACVPDLILENISNSTQDLRDVYIIIAVFYNDDLFVDDDFASAGNIVSVTIPGYGSYLESPLVVVFKTNNDSNKCGYWDNRKTLSRRKSKWSDVGGSYLGPFNNKSTIHTCSYVHLTHFALLIISDRKYSSEENGSITEVQFNNEYVLNVITIIGGTFSVIGITGIFLTALMFENWRKKIGTKILLHLSVAILLETICIHLSEIKTLTEHEESCRIIGMILHYVVICKFCWMLVYAFLQYLRFVKVLSIIPNNLILKSVAFGWGVPLIIVVIAGLISNSYNSTSYQICYPRGIFLYVLVLLPILVISLINLTIFCLIMYKINTSKVQSAGSSKLFQIKLFLALLLFFVLGLPWLFGLIAELVSASVIRLVLIYIFCFTGTLQGFVLFMFYVALNKETQMAWIHYINNKTLAQGKM